MFLQYYDNEEKCYHDLGSPQLIPTEMSELAPQVAQPINNTVPNNNASTSDGYVFPPCYNGPLLQEAINNHDYNKNMEIIGNANVVPLPNCCMMQAPSYVANKVRKVKRYRTAFTTNQLSALEIEFQQSRYIDRARRIQLSEMLQLSDRSIKVWFQNRRMKEKKDRAASQDTSITSTRYTEGWIRNIPVPVLLYEQLPTIQE
ncbi:hypothetical protein evm_013762 [Chilo suppressalis]|nr:hypothetical protein evm_013762 [Chilo suppressalis]